MRSFITLQRHGELTRALGVPAVWLVGLFSFVYLLHVYLGSWHGTFERHWTTSDGDSTTNHHAVRTTAGRVEDPTGWFPAEVRRPGLPLTKSPMTFWVREARIDGTGDAGLSLMLWSLYFALASWLGGAALRELDAAVSFVPDRGLLILHPAGERHLTRGVTARLVDQGDSDGPMWAVQLHVPGLAPWVVRRCSLESDARDLLAQVESYLPERAAGADLVKIFAPVSRQAPRPVRATGGACRVCGTGLATQVVGCPRCDTPHHADCWDYAGGCSTYACGAKAMA